MTINTCVKCHKGSQWFKSQYCFSCMREKDERQLSEDILTGKVISTDYEDDIVCPWCGARWTGFDEDESADYLDEAEYETTCDNCEKNLIYSASVSISFSTRRK